MSDVTRVLNSLAERGPEAAQELVPTLCDELRRLAAAKMAHERPGQTLKATALVHEHMAPTGRFRHAAALEQPGHFFAVHDKDSAELIKLCFSAGMGNEEAAEGAAFQDWGYCRACMRMLHP